MSTSKHPDDISIGPNQWIAHVDINGRQAEAVDLDPLILPMDEFWSLLETDCVAECCGMDAFSFWPEDIKSVGSQVANRPIRDQLEQLKKFVKDSETDIFISVRLNQYFHSKVITQLLDHFLEHLNT